MNWLSSTLIGHSGKSDPGIESIGGSPTTSIRRSASYNSQLNGPGLSESITAKVSSSSTSIESPGCKHVSAPVSRSQSVGSQDNIPKSRSASSFEFTKLVVIPDMPGTKIVELKPHPIFAVDPPVATGIVRSSTSRLNILSPSSSSEVNFTVSEGEKRLKARFSKRLLSEKSVSFTGIENFRQKKPRTLKRSYSAKLMQVPEVSDDSPSLLSIHKDDRKVVSDCGPLETTCYNDSEAFTVGGIFSRNTSTTSLRSVFSNTTQNSESSENVLHGRRNSSIEGGRRNSSTEGADFKQVTGPRPSELVSLNPSWSKGMHLSEQFSTTELHRRLEVEQIDRASLSSQNQSRNTESESDVNSKVPSIANTASETDVTTLQNDSGGMDAFSKQTNVLEIHSDMSIIKSLASSTKCLNEEEPAAAHSITCTTEMKTDTANWFKILQQKLEKERMDRIKESLERRIAKDIEEQNKLSAAASSAIDQFKDIATDLLSYEREEYQEQWTLEMTRKRESTLKRSLSANYFTVQRAQLQSEHSKPFSIASMFHACGKIQFSMHYNNPNRTFRVTLIKACDLVMSSKSLSSTKLFAKVLLIPGKYKKRYSKKVAYSGSPEFNETFDFPNMDICDLVDMSLRITLHRKGRLLSSSKRIGETYTSIKNYDVYFGKTIWKSLRTSSDEVSFYFIYRQYAYGLDIIL